MPQFFDADAYPQGKRDIAAQAMEAIDRGATDGMLTGTARQNVLHVVGLILAAAEAPDGRLREPDELGLCALARYILEARAAQHGMRIEVIAHPGEAGQ